MSCIVCNKVDTGEHNLDVVWALQHAGVCHCVRELQRDHIQRQNMAFQINR